MNLFQGKLNNNGVRSYSQQGIRSAYHTGKMTAANQADVGKTLDMKNLVPGQVIKGEIANVINKEVTITMPNLQELTALLVDNIDINIGELLYFQVKDAKEGQITLRPMKIEGMNVKDQTIEKALSASGLQLTEKNMTIVRALMDASLPIDRPTLLKIVQQSYAFPDADIKALVQMNQLSIPMTKENLDQFINYKNYENSIVSAVDQMVEQVGGYIEQLTTELPTTELLKQTNQLLNVFTPPTDQVSPMPRPIPVMLDQVILPEQKESLHNTLLNLANKGNEETKAELNKLAVQIQEGGTLEIKELLQQIETILSKDATIPAKDIGELFIKSEFLPLFKSYIKQQWTISPEQLKESKDVNELYDRIYQQSGKLKEMFEGGTKEGATVSKQASSMKENIDFMKTLNQMFTYMQLPLKLKNQMVHSELFVYTNKKNLAKKDGEIRILLHLDMEKLGALDIHVHLRASNVNTRFYVESKETMDIIDNNIDQLKDKLEGIGYTLSNEMCLRTEKPDFVEDLLGKDVSTNSVKRYSFDVRM